MASKPTNGPDANERDNPGDTGTNPSGVSSDKPAEGPDDLPDEHPGSPSG
jgi:hypothetical protein